MCAGTWRRARRGVPHKLMPSSAPAAEEVPALALRFSRALAWANANSSRSSSESWSASSRSRSSSSKSRSLCSPSSASASKSSSTPSTILRAELLREQLREPNADIESPNSEVPVVPHLVEGTETCGTVSSFDPRGLRCLSSGMLAYIFEPSQRASGSAVPGMVTTDKPTLLGEGQS